MTETTTDEVKNRVRSPLPSYNALTASAKIMPADKKLTPTYESWQVQLWDYYDRLGEFESGVSWLSNTMSRVRLVAAELSPGGDEPEPLDEGPAAEIVSRLAGGTGGQAQLTREMTTHLAIPGEGWIVGEATPDGEEKWQVYSADELRVSQRRVEGAKVYEVRESDETGRWRQLSSESIVVRFWDPHPRFGWKANSAARHAMSAMLELDLINKRIIAEIISRLASNGILLYDKGKLSFDAVEPDADGNTPDPFAAMLVDVASRGIRDPTSPEATIPIPIGYDVGDAGMQDVDPKSLLQHVKIADLVSDKLLAERESAVKRLATSLDMPAEVLLGMAGLNHWGAWQIEESGIKIHVAPKAELICYCLTVGYLIPALKAAGADLKGPNGGQLVVWYDPSEITVRPDRSADTIKAYEYGEVPGRVLRREIGLSEDDAPTQDEFRDWVTRFLMRQPESAQAVLESFGGPVMIDETGKVINGDELPEPAQPPQPGQEDQTEEDDTGSNGPPQRDDTRPDESDQAPPPASLDDAQLLDMYSALESEVKKRFGRQGTTWVEAGVPHPDRVAPVRRNGESGS